MGMRRGACAPGASGVGPLPRARAGFAQAAQAEARAEAESAATAARLRPRRARETRVSAAGWPRDALRALAFARARAAPRTVELIAAAARRMVAGA